MNDFQNYLLQTLEPKIVRRLELKPIVLVQDHEIELPGKYIDNILFLEQGVAATVTLFSDGTRATILLAGSESVLGSCSMIGSPRGYHRIFMLNDGKGFISNKAAALSEYRRGEHFHDLLLGYHQLQFIQAAQTTGCNAIHSLEQRLSKWLLLCADRNGGGVLPLSHEYMASLLTATRPTISTLASQFQSKGFIQYTRGKLRVVNSAGLESVTCECYGMIREQIEEYIQGKPLEPSGLPVLELVHHRLT